jgi:hypothetical protein
LKEGGFADHRQNREEKEDEKLQECLLKAEKGRFADRWQTTRGKQGHKHSGKKGTYEYSSSKQHSYSTLFQARNPELEKGNVIYLVRRPFGCVDLR